MSLSGDTGNEGDGGVGWRKKREGSVCVGGERGKEEVSNYFPPPWPPILSPGFICPRHLQIKFVLRMSV